MLTTILIIILNIIQFWGVALVALLGLAMYGWAAYREINHLIIAGEGGTVSRKSTIFSLFLVLTAVCVLTTAACLLPN